MQDDASGEADHEVLQGGRGWGGGLYAGAALAKIPASSHAQLPVSKILTLEVAQAIADEAVAQ